MKWPVYFTGKSCRRNLKLKFIDWPSFKLEFAPQMVYINDHGQDCGGRCISFEQYQVLCRGEKSREPDQRYWRAILLKPPFAPDLRQRTQYAISRWACSYSGRQYGRFVCISEYQCLNVPSSSSNCSYWNPGYGTNERARSRGTSWQTSADTLDVPTIIYDIYI